MSQSASILSVRVSTQERQLLEDAAEQSRTSLSDFVRRTALDAAEEELMERRVVMIPADKWEALEEWMNAPAKDVSALRELAQSASTWER